MTDKEMKVILKEHLNIFQKSILRLQESYERCQAIGEKEEYSSLELEIFEALTSRFSRACDFLVSKVFRTLDMLEAEEGGTMIDVIHRAEKRGIIEDSYELREMKKIRNEIVHEYVEEEIIETFKKVLNFTSKLIQIFENLNKYCEKYKG